MILNESYFYSQDLENKKCILYSYMYYIFFFCVLVNPGWFAFHPTSFLSVLFLMQVDISFAWRAPFGFRLAHVGIWQPLAIGRRSASLYLSLSGFSFCRFGRASIQTAVFSPSISRICFSSLSEQYLSELCFISLN